MLQGKTTLNGGTSDKNIAAGQPADFDNEVYNTGPDSMPGGTGGQEWGWKVEACYDDPGPKHNNHHDCSHPSDDDSNYAPKNCGTGGLSGAQLGDGGNTQCSDACADGSNSCLPSNLSLYGIQTGNTLAQQEANAKPQFGAAGQNGYKFPMDADPGTKYCEVIFYKYSTPDDSAYDTHSRVVCASYNPTPTPTPSTVTSCTSTHVSARSVVNGTAGYTEVTLSGRVDASGKLISDTGTVVFNHQINNDGTCPVKLAWQVNGSYSAGATTFGSTHCGGGTASDPGDSACLGTGHLPGSGGSVVVQPGHNAPSFASGNAQSSYHFTAGTQVGTEYCQDISWSGDVAGDTAVQKVCVKLVSASSGASGTCPGDGKINANTIVTINLPDQTPSGEHSGPGEPGDSDHKVVLTAADDAPRTWYQNVSENKSSVVSVQDNSSSSYGGSSVPLSYILHLI
jgi:hypothetical protein